MLERRPDRDGGDERRGSEVWMVSSWVVVWLVSSRVVSGLFLLFLVVSVGVFSFLSFLSVFLLLLWWSGVMGLDVSEDWEQGGLNDGLGWLASGSPRLPSMVAAFARVRRAWLRGAVVRLVDGGGFVALVAANLEWACMVAVLQGAWLLLAKFSFWRVLSGEANFSDTVSGDRWAASFCLATGWLWR